MNDWSYEKNGVRHDNIPEDTLADMARAGEISTATLVWRAGMADWAPLENTPLSAYLQQRTAPPALPSSHIPSAFVWLLACAPVLGFLLEAFFAGLSGINEEMALNAVTSGQFWYITLILNIALGYLDEWKLRKAGVDTQAFGKIAWFVPGYLWRRHRTLKQSPASFWVWCILFILTLLA